MVLCDLGQLRPRRVTAHDHLTDARIEPLTLVLVKFERRWRFGEVQVQRGPIQSGAPFVLQARPAGHGRDHRLGPVECRLEVSVGCPIAVFQHIVVLILVPYLDEDFG